MSAGSLLPINVACDHQHNLPGFDGRCASRILPGSSSVPRPPSVHCSASASPPSASAPQSASTPSPNLRGRPRSLAAFRVAVCSLALFLFGCESPRVDARPELLVREFIDRMRRVHGDPIAARRAYELLWSQAKSNLTERAKRATAVLGKTVLPEEMLAPSRFSLNYRPRNFRARVQGKWSLVTVTGEVPATQKTEVKCTLEGEHWRVALELPPLSPIRKRTPETGG
ncbi:MAG: hypothetical protein SFV15_05955 [Polyangiaceae bacterium]|nr:hypothetical protein [Polyangiaceae bacterium]